VEGVERGYATVALVDGVDAEKVAAAAERPQAGDCPKDSPKEGPWR